MDSIATVGEKVEALGADSVYMFLHPGWRQERRANRWHFATRWARYLPTTLVLPEASLWPMKPKADPRIPNCRILSTIPMAGYFPPERVALQFSRVLLDMKQNGHRRPILWLYNSEYVECFAALPAVKRVHHATENYFDFPGLSDEYLDRIRGVMAVADLTVAVSSGCAAPLRTLCEPSRLMVVTNGCDYREYSTPQSALKTFSDVRSAGNRLAVFAGGINDRLDLDLIAKMADDLPRTTSVLIGDEAFSPSKSKAFKRLCMRSNVVFLGRVDPDELPGIYQAADVGVIPYVTDRLIVNNGFPLKALEMAAAGLPVVTTQMRPLTAYSPPLEVTSTYDEFVEKVANSRRSHDLQQSLRALAAANDYDAKFEGIVEALLNSNSDAPVTSVDLSTSHTRLQLDKTSRVSVYHDHLDYAFRVQVVPRLLPYIGRALGVAVKIRNFLFRRGTIK
ncbi:MAG: glycosyltransferase [Proteobacteria bacterium]|nr:glycosyltransferase [Pseudomonadota bacterium]